MIVLRGGGEIQGKVIPDPRKPDTVQVLLLKGRNPLSFQKKQILQVIPKASPLDTYLVKKTRSGPTAQAEYELGLWCEQNQLADLAKVHYEAALGSRQDVRAGPQEARACPARRPVALARRAQPGAGTGQVQGEVDHRGREGQAGRVGPGDRDAGLVGAADQDAPASDRQPARRTAGARPRTS